MPKNFNHLRDKLPLAARGRSHRLALKYEAEMALDELRVARDLTQEHLAQILGIKQAAVSVPGVVNVEKCLVRKMGISFYVDLHIGVDGGISVRDGHAIAHQVKDAIKQSDPRIVDVLVHIEPAL